jgi:Raf kinase inhibitor-like YbhB/YbcL family protein
MRPAILAIALTLIYAAPASSQLTSPGGEGPVLAKQIAPARQNMRLTVRSSAFIGGGAIPERHTKNGENVSPPLTWTKGPQGTRSYAIIVEDARSGGDEPAAHWIIYDIDGSQTQLESNVAKESTIRLGAHQAKNSEGSTGYSGPNPAEGRSGSYHFQVFALNTKLNLDPASADRDMVTAAMKGKVLASGDLIGRFPGQ